MKRILVLICMIVWLGGCQTAPLFLGSSDRAETSVMDLWKTYNHCRSTKDSYAMEVDARELNSAAQRFTAPKPSPIRLPAILKKHVVEQSPRFSVDPKAMSASCSLHTAQAALRSGRVDVAREMFTSVLQDQSDTAYTYYAEQARAGLRRIQTPMLVSEPQTPQLIPVSSTEPIAEGFVPLAAPRTQ